MQVLEEKLRAQYASSSRRELIQAICAVDEGLRDQLEDVDNNQALIEILVRERVKIESKEEAGSAEAQKVRADWYHIPARASV